MADCKYLSQKDPTTKLTVMAVGTGNGNEGNCILFLFAAISWYNPECMDAGKEGVGSGTLFLC